MRPRDHAGELARPVAHCRLVGVKVAVLGLTFKPDSDDVRDLPALDIAGRVWGPGAIIITTDLAGADAVSALRPHLKIVDTADEALDGADLVMLLTAWKEYVSTDPVHAKPLVAAPRVIDGRNVLDPQRRTDAGCTYRGMGRR